jgi:YggT family protein
MSYLIQALITLLQFVIGIYLMLVLLRFLFQLVRADFYNPISQAIVNVTNPPLRILRKFVPGFAGIDWPSIILLFSIQAVEICLLTLLLTSQMPSPAALFVLCLAQLLQLTAYVYMFFIFITVIISWINPGAYNPLTVLIYQLIDPLMRRIRQHIPTTAGLDWSPMVALLGIYLFLSLVVAPLMDLGNSLNR